MRHAPPASVAQLFADYQKRTAHNTFSTGRLEFTGVGDKDVYNITAPFTSAGQVVIAGRVEARDSEHSTIVFFSEQQGQWAPVETHRRSNYRILFSPGLRMSLFWAGLKLIHTLITQGNSSGTPYFSVGEIFTH